MDHRENDGPVTDQISHQCEARDNSFSPSPYSITCNQYISEESHQSS